MSYASDFFNKWFPVAQRESDLTGIPASVILAQGLIESTSRTGGSLSALAQKANNFFGIKADKSWNGQIYAIGSPEYINGKYETKVSGFRKYSSPDESWRDHSLFLLENPRYREYGVFSSQDPRKVAEALQRAGYATNPNYAKDIMSVINQYGLTQYDKGGSTGSSSNSSGIINTASPADKEYMKKLKERYESGDMTPEERKEYEEKMSQMMGGVFSPDTWKNGYNNLTSAFSMEKIVRIVVIILLVVVVIVAIFMTIKSSAVKSVGGAITEKI